MSISNSDLAPALDSSFDPDQDQEEQGILRALKLQRQRVDEEIAQFRALKEQEFRDFETNLRSRRRGSAGQNGHKHDPTNTVAPIRIPAKSTPSKCATTVDARSSRRQNLDEKVLSDQLRTLSGEDRIALTLPSPSPSPSRSSSTAIQSAMSASSAIVTNTPPAYERERDFHGLFTPAFLPLLESKQVPLTALSSSNSPKNSPNATKPKPASVRDKRNSLDLRSDKTTSPLIQPSSSLPSALRRTSSDGRPKSPKHVTFRLSDFTVVDPASSYQEAATGKDTSPMLAQTPSPEEFQSISGRISPHKSTSAQQHSLPKEPLRSSLRPDQRARIFSSEEEDEDDPVFALDEEFTSSSSPSTAITGGGRRPQTPEEDDVPDMSLDADSPARLHESKEDLMSGSPGAGSLPISISRPPPRRGLEGGMYSVA